MKTIGIYILHNQYSHANPQAISPSGNEVTFSLDGISDELKDKVYGKMELVELTPSEMEEILKAKTRIEKLSDTTIARLFGKL